VTKQVRRRSARPRQGAKRIARSQAIAKGEDYERSTRPAAARVLAQVAAAAGDARRLKSGNFFVFLQPRSKNSGFYYV
jgi:hypothetical protein